MNVFITGGNGFLGSHLCESLKTNNRITIFDNFSNSSKKSIKQLENDGIKVIHGDICNEKILSKSIQHSDFVIHLAAQIDVTDSILNPEKTHRVNVTGSVNLLRACVKNNIKNIIAASSAAVYGNSSENFLKETSPTNPLSPYGASKIAMESYLKSFSNAYDLNCISLRFFNIYGNGQSLKHGGVITKFIHSLASRQPLIIHGTGRNTRDFVHVDDVIQSIKNSMSKINGKTGNVYNIASGKSISLNEIIKIIFKLSNKKVPIKHIEKRQGDILHSKTSIKLAKKDLNYSPKINIRNGIKNILIEQKIIEG